MWLKSDKKYTFHFDGAGHAGTYYMGVLDFMDKHFDLRENVRFYGTSAGNIPLIWYLAGLEISYDAFSEIEELAMSNAYCTLGCGFCGTLSFYRKTLDKILPHDIHERINGTYGATICHYPFGNFDIIEDFQSKKDVLDALVASASFPGFVWRPQCLCSSSHGIRCVYDGGLSNACTPMDPLFSVSVRSIPLKPATPNLLQRDEPFPASDYMCWPSRKKFELRYQQGYEDARNFFMARKDDFRDLFKPGCESKMDAKVGIYISDV